MCANNLRHLRTIEGAQRRATIRAMLVKSDGVVFGQDVHVLSASQCIALQNMARAVSWRKSISSCLSLGSAFYVYLSREVQS